MRFKVLFPAFILCLALITICGALPQVSAAPGLTPTRSRLGPRTPSSTADAGARHFEAAGGFSFVPPKGWSLEDLPGLKYQTAVDHRSGSFPPNIVVTDDPYSGSLESFVVMFRAIAKQSFDSLKVIEQKPFAPTGGAPAIRLILETVQGSLKLRQNIYLFDRGTAKIIAICSRLADRHQDVDALCDTSLKTFRFEALPKGTPGRTPTPRPFGTSTWKSVYNVGG